MRDCLTNDSVVEEGTSSSEKAGNISINIEEAYFSEKVKKKSLEIGRVFNLGEVFEVNTHKLRYQIKEFETYLEKNEIPHEIYIGGTVSMPPKVKKFNPKENISKEINCFCYTGQDHGDEDGIIAVSELEEILRESNSANLLENLNKLIKERKF